MKKSIKLKLIFSYLIVALLTVVVVSALIRLTSGQSLMNLVVQQETADLKNAAQSYYTANGTLNGFFDIFMANSYQMPKPDPMGEKNMRGLNGMVDVNHRALIPFAGFNIGDMVPEDHLNQAVEVKVEDETIAWIIPDTKYQFALNAEEKVFIQRTNLIIGVAALAGVLAAVIIGYILASRLIIPIRRLTQVSSLMAMGELQQRVPVTSQDELGQLSTAFNKMSADLFENDQKRKRFTADITHDLSTPLQIISGYIEMLQEGEVTLTPERIEVIKTEVEHLRRLVGDMTTLTQAESGSLDIQLQPLNPVVLMEHIQRIYHPIVKQKGVDLTLKAGDEDAWINADEGRLVQVLKNLMDNALRYTSSGGTITLSVEKGDFVRLLVSDSGEGIDAEDLPYVFDRFYRVEKSRTGSSGKMGLGLAICKALIHAQGGVISVESPGKGGGTSFVISFRPLEAKLLTS